MKKEMMEIGKRLYDYRLTAAKGGNLSCRLTGSRMLMTRNGTCLGVLTESDLLEVDISDNADGRVQGLSTEFALHKAILETLPFRCVLHCHPPLTNAYFSVYSKLRLITHESRFSLGEVPVVEQETPNVSEPAKVVDVLRQSNIVVIRNHGVVCVSDDFQEAYYLVESLEEAVKTAGFASLLGDENPDIFKQALTAELANSGRAYEMFSEDHILTIVSLIRQDETFLKKAKALGLSAEVAIKLDDKPDSTFKFHFVEGNIVHVGRDDDAPFVISGPADPWRRVFEGKLDPFVATTQGKLKLKGELGRLSKWYVPFTRMFSLFKAVRIQ